MNIGWTSFSGPQTTAICGVQTPYLTSAYNKVKEKFIFRDLGKVIVVGRKNSINVYELIGDKDSTDKSVIEMLKVFHKGLSCYHSQEWDKALEYFNKSNAMESRSSSLWMGMVRWNRDEGKRSKFPFSG